MGTPHSNRGRQEPSHHIAQVDRFVEVIQLARVVEGRQNERGETQQEKVQGARRAAAAEVDEQTDSQVQHAYRVLIVERGIAGDLANNHGSRHFRAVVHDLVLGLMPSAEAGQNFRGFLGAADPQTIDRDQAVAFVDPGFLSRTSGSDVGCNRNRLAGHLLIYPGDAIVGHVEFTLLLEIDRRSDDCRHGDDHQQSVR